MCFSPILSCTIDFFFFFLQDLGHSSSRAVGATCGYQPHLAAISLDWQCLYSEVALPRVVACCVSSGESTPSGCSPVFFFECSFIVTEIFFSMVMIHFAPFPPLNFFCFEALRSSTEWQWGDCNLLDTRGPFSFWPSVHGLGQRLTLSQIATSVLQLFVLGERHSNMISHCFREAKNNLTQWWMINPQTNPTGWNLN